MSFFGFDTALPRDRAHNASAPGFAQAADPFAGLQRPGDDEDAIDFEETYDGLGDKLDDADDAFNDDTFGDVSGPSAPKPVGKDFDFFGQTAKVSDAITEEQLRFHRHQPAPRPMAVPSYEAPQPLSRPARTGYERYKEPEIMPSLQADASLWGTLPKKSPAAVELPAAIPPGAHSPAAASAAAAANRKFLSLEEVEAQMRAQASKPASQAPPPQQQQFDAQVSQMLRMNQNIPQQPQQTFQGYPPQQPPHLPHQHSQSRELPVSQQFPPQALQQPQAPPSAPKKILQNPNRHPAEQQAFFNQQQQRGAPPTGPRNQFPVITHPQQLTSMSEEERAAFLMEEAKRAKRNHKIFLLSKDNGLMTPQDKNFITRIQLQQLVTATGNPNEHGSDASLSEDFYYQVHNQIQGGPRLRPDQPLSNFAQTYLHQTGARHGMRRHNRGGDNHVQRMEQQVQRAVEAAKNKPKNKQLVIEGSLGKISFSNAKTPKPLLNIKRHDSSSESRKVADVTGTDRKTVLRDIENVYNTLMQMEDHDRSIPPPLTGEPSQELVNKHIEWNEKMQALNNKLWRELKVHEPIGTTTTHPFIAFLSFSKGKKAIPRVFRHINHEQRTTILTMIVIHLDQLDVVRQAQLSPTETQLSASVRENVELFSMAVIPSLFGYLSEAELGIVTGILGLLLRVNVDMVARTRVGVSMLTMILSRAELIKQAGGASEQDWEHWTSTYNDFFDALEPSLFHIFPGTVNTGEDVYVWQFLAAIGIGASPEQQQRLVMAVKDRVMETVGLAKTLPPAMSSQRLANVNLFMRSIGLDVELLA